MQASSTSHDTITAQSHGKKLTPPMGFHRRSPALTYFGSDEKVHEDKGASYMKSSFTLADLFLSVNATTVLGRKA